MLWLHRTRKLSIWVSPIICIYAMIFLCDCHTGICLRVLEYLTSEGSKWIRYDIINTRTEMKFVSPSAEIDEIAKMISSHVKVKMISSKLLHDEDFIYIFTCEHTTWQLDISSICIMYIWLWRTVHTSELDQSKTKAIWMWIWRRTEID